MGHIHISTEFLFVIAIFVIGLVGIITWAYVARKNRKEELAVELEFNKNRPVYRDRFSSPPVERIDRYPNAANVPAYMPSRQYPAASSGPPVASAPATQVIHTGDGGSGMLTGVLVGSMLANSGHHDTVYRDTPAPVPSHSRDPDYSGGGSSSSGGLDISWGSDSSSGSSDSGGWSFDSSC